MAKNVIESRPEGAPPGLVQRGAWYHYRRNFNGKITTKSLKTKNYNQAVRLVLELNEQIEDKGANPTLVVNKDSFDFEKAALLYLDTRQLQPRTLKRYAGYITTFQAAFEEITGKPIVKLSEVTRQLVEDFCSHRKNAMISRNGHPNTAKTKGVSDKTLSGEIQFLKGVLKHAVEREWLAKEPKLDKIATVKRRKGQPSEASRILGDDELALIFNSAREYDKAHIGNYAYPNMFEAIIQMYLYTAFRHEEGQFLEWSDIDFNAETIKMRKKQVLCKRTLKLTSKAWEFIQTHINPDHNKQAFKDDKKLLFDLGYKIGLRAYDKLLSIKGKDFNQDNLTLDYTEVIDWQPKASEGIIPMHPKLKETLQNLHIQKISNFVFPDKNGGYWRFDMLDRLNVIAKAGGVIGNVRVHDLRHTFATSLRRKGVGIETLKELLRHADISETMIYAHYSLEEGFNAVKLLPDQYV